MGNWFTDLLKHLSVAKGATFAFFLTSVALLAGPNYSNRVEAVPPSWRWAPAAVCVFTGTLLLLWLLPFVARCFANAWRASRQWKWLNPPNAAEEWFLELLGRHSPNAPININDMNYSKDGPTKIEIIALCGSLADKGLVRINPHMEELVSLTDKGRSVALNRITANRETT